MFSKYYKLISQKVQISEKQIISVNQLLEEGATIPFIARYRKEATGNLDEVILSNTQELLIYYRELEKRKETILKTIESLGKLTDELKLKIDNCNDAIVLEDIYLPYKPKKKTKASIAREQGLEPLALTILEQDPKIIPENIASNYITEEVSTIEDALQGARNIIAEIVNEDIIAREKIRNLFKRTAIIHSKIIRGKDEEGIKYKDYFKLTEPLAKCPSHRLLAMRRGEKEGFLNLDISIVEEDAINALQNVFVKNNSESAKQIQTAIDDSYKRLLKSAIEVEFRLSSKNIADDEAIEVFASNTRQLLLSSPLGQKCTLALDPGFRTGCKLVILDHIGNMIHNSTIYPHAPQNEWDKAQETILQLVDTYNVQAIAIGNGTAGKETESLSRSINFKKPVEIYMVNEAGASIYSASEAAREEFGDYDITVRGAVSIGRRLMDPLSELVKIDPKSIGVGQYQHDVNQTKLKEKLDAVIVSCVNAVGVDINIASKHLLNYVSGIGPTLAKNIVEYRNTHGVFKSRNEMKKVSMLGNKAFEQAAGFLKIRDGENPLDNSAVHPESYSLVNKFAHDLNCTVIDLINNKELRQKIDPTKYISNQVGLFTIQDILKELEKPGLDPRAPLKPFFFAEGIHKIEDLYPGLILPGVITNITNFGAFVDIGVKQDGMVHISHLANKFVKDPNEVVTLNQQVQVKVLSVEIERKRIQLSIKEAI